MQRFCFLICESHLWFESNRMGQPLVWFITGCSSGFGASLALLALRNGHHVIATSRNPSKTPDIISKVKELGGTWLILDICGSDLPSVVESATQIYGKIDILVNNAGYCLLGAFETFTYVSLIKF